MRLGVLIVSACLLTVSVMPVSAQQFKTERLKAARIQARGYVPRAQRLLWGIPVLSYNNGGYDRNQPKAEPEVLLTNSICGVIYGEKLEYSEGVWVSHNLDFGMPNWIAWDMDMGVAFDSSSRDMLRRYMPADKLRLDSLLWNSVLDECSKWALEKPLGKVSIVCGPLVYGPERQKGSAAVPYEYFLVMCKKCKGRLGFKSVGFLIPNRVAKGGGHFRFSDSVNVVEHKSGYNFFPSLPENLQELIEGMTTYELFCSYVEQEGFIDDPS